MPPAADLTACFVTRDHARDLPAALASARLAAAHLLVLDTGSADGTVRVAEAHGARAVTFAWADDFAAANNAALDAVTTGWVLWLNPDEALDADSAGRVAAAVADPGVLAFALRVQQQLAAGRPASGPSNAQWRLFRRRDALRYVGRLHPALTPTPDLVAPGLGLGVRTLDATVVRHAYLNEVTPDKIRFSNRLIEAELRDRPGQLARTVELGCNLLLVGDPRGHEVLGEAAAVLKPVFERGEAPPPGVGPLVEYLLGVPPEQNRGPLDRDAARRVAAAWYLDEPPVLWALAGDRYVAQDFALAAKVLARLLELGVSGGYAADLGFDPDIVGRGALMNLGQCQLQLTRLPEARACFAALLGDDLHGPRAAELLAVVEKLERQTLDKDRPAD